MCSLLCNIFLIFWCFVLLKVDQYYSELYLTEKIWLCSWIIVQTVCFLVAYIATTAARCNPRILLNFRFNRRIGKFYMFFFKFQIVLFINVLFIDVEKFIFELTDIKFTCNSGGEVSENESTINTFVRFV